MPQGNPTEPGLRARGGIGLVATVPDVSVSPMVSIMGTPKVSSHCLSTTTGSGADAERPKRKGARRGSAPKSKGSSAARSRRYLMIVGTTLDQVHPWVETRSQNRLARKRDGITTLPALTSGATTVTMAPLMW